MGFLIGHNKISPFNESGTVLALNLKNATDDSSLVERLGHRVKIVKGSFRNIKITTHEDLELARIFVTYINHGG